MDAGSDGQPTPPAQEGPGTTRPPSSSPERSDINEPLSAYSRTRFLEAVRGTISMDVYIHEVSDHVEKQLPRYRHIG